MLPGGRHCATQLPFSGNVVGLGDFDFGCPGILTTHRRDSHHGRSGLELSGAFRSKRLGTYPARLATWIAERLVATFLESRTAGRGPALGERATGGINHTTPSWSALRLPNGSAALLRELAVAERSFKLNHLWRPIFMWTTGSSPAPVLQVRRGLWQRRSCTILPT